MSCHQAFATRPAAYIPGTSHRLHTPLCRLPYLLTSGKADNYYYLQPVREIIQADIRLLRTHPFPVLKPAVGCACCNENKNIINNKPYVAGYAYSILRIRTGSQTLSGAYLYGFFYRNTHLSYPMYNGNRIRTTRMCILNPHQG